MTAPATLLYTILLFHCWLDWIPVVILFNYGFHGSLSFETRGRIQLHRMLLHQTMLEATFAATAPEPTDRLGG